MSSLPHVCLRNQAEQSLQKSKVGTQRVLRPFCVPFFCAAGGFLQGSQGDGQSHKAHLSGTQWVYALLKQNLSDALYNMDAHTGVDQNRARNFIGTPGMDATCKTHNKKAEMIPQNTQW